MQIPDKQAFRIGEVATLLGVRPSVLRFWETEFKSVRPQKSRSGQRLYTRANVERLVEIRRLLYELKFTIAGARRRLREPGAEAQPDEESTPGPRQRAWVEALKREVRELLRLTGD